jgi:aminoglycoside 6'-N-acetyltransferase
MRISFRALTASELPLLHEWLQREHVRRWWKDRQTYDEVVEHYLPAIEGRDPTDLYVLQVDGRSVGFIQTYLVSDYPDYRDLVAVEEGVAGVDLFIADEELTGRGLGSRALAQFLREVVFAVPTTNACVADPDARNVTSIRAFEKAGFRAVRELVDASDEDRVHMLMRIDRG